MGPTAASPVSSNPDSPVLIYPSNGATGVELKPTFKWSGGGNKDYIEVATDINFQNIIYSKEFNILDIKYFNIFLQPETTYFWHVKAYWHTQYYSDWSQTWCFTTGIN